MLLFPSLIFALQVHFEQKQAERSKSSICFPRKNFSFQLAFNQILLAIFAVLDLFPIRRTLSLTKYQYFNASTFNRR